jgi:hypothetical protein
MFHILGGDSPIRPTVFIANEGHPSINPSIPGLKKHDPLEHIRPLVSCTQPSCIWQTLTLLTRLCSRQVDPDWLGELSEYNVFYYIDRGPNQLKRVLDSPMLETASERRFALSQLGTGNIWFVADHAFRMNHALQTMHHWFTQNELDEICRPTSPYHEDLIDFRTSSHPSEAVPSMLDTFDLVSPTPYGPETASIQPAKPPRFRISVDALVNPGTPEPQSLKRKMSDAAGPAMTPGSSPGESAEGLQSPPTLIKSLTFNLGRKPRTLRDVRKRRSRTRRRHNGKHDGLEPETPEEHGSLLLDFHRSGCPLRFDGPSS